MKTAICALNAKYIHSSLAPWCLAAGVAEHAPEQQAVVIEGTINEPPQAVLARILEQKPDVVTFSCYLWNIRQTLQLAQTLKQAASLTIVLGGPEVSYNATQVLNENPQIDFILSGEGETSLPAFLMCLAKGEATHNVQGLCTRTEISAPCVLTTTPPSPYTQNYLKGLKGRIAYLETSRGCPFTCAFCLSGRCGTPRYFPLERAFSDLLILANSGAQTVKLIDRTFNASPKHANAILRFILEHYGNEIPAGVCFHFEIAGDILQEETMQLFSQMPVGAVQLEIGMQSFCEKTLAAVRRKTDTTQLKENIRKLVAMQNMHIHIDLIAGLPYEDLQTFANSFNDGYALQANMLQMGFLKLLHGAPMREETETFPCTFDENPPYEVMDTPWLNEKELSLLHQTEDALERVYNSGRFPRTAAYVLNATGMTPFDFYTMLGTHVAAPLQTSLDAYTALFYEFCKTLPHINNDGLRDVMVCDRLSTNATGRLPVCLQVKDPDLKKAVQYLAKTDPPPKGIRRGVALLYGEQKIVFVDYQQKQPITGQYPLHKCAIDKRFEK